MLHKCARYKCDKQASAATTFGDGGRGRVLSTMERRPTPVDHTQQRTALCKDRWAIERDATRRAGPFASDETCKLWRLQSKIISLKRLKLMPVTVFF